MKIWKYKDINLYLCIYKHTHIYTGMYIINIHTICDIYMVINIYTYSCKYINIKCLIKLLKIVA